MPRTKTFDQQKVLEKAMELFWQKGYHATSMQDLVDHLGINRASIYDTYGGKRQLFDSAFTFYRRINTDGLVEILNEEIDVKSRFRLLFESAVKESIKDKNSKGCFVVNTTTELVPGDKDLEKVLRENREAIEMHFYEILKRGRERAEIGEEKDIEALASLFFTFYNGLKVVSKTGASEESLLGAVKEFLEVLD